MAQLVKNPPTMWETWVRSLGWEDPLEKARLPTPVFWPGEFHGLYSFNLDGGFPASSVGEESVCNAGDPGSIPGLGSSPGEGIAYPL